ncbi:MAG: dihydropteroate synthase [Betaproteobacteria bacterium]|nr:dihydropteroate synthase [Betaproteobacteria bacterium]
MNCELIAGRFTLGLDRPLVMGIVNVTPDSFSDGGQHASAGAAIAHAWRLIEEGSDILDIGGESSRPGAQPVGTAEELARVMPVLAALRDAKVPLSIDTAKPVVMRAAIDAGASMVNDIEALRRPDALATVAASNAAVCLMHMQGVPRTMQTAPAYSDVIGEVGDFLRDRAQAALDAGISRERIVLDPGFGFGKSAEHNLVLMRRFGELGALGFPLLAGISRKATLGALTGRSAGERVYASVAAALILAQRGAAILRVHDVAATRDALAILTASG